MLANKLPRYYFLIGFFITIVGLVIFRINDIWSSSVDLAHHYALSFRIFENLSLANFDDPSLGEMNVYPNTSHLMAALVGSIFNSIFVGIQVITVLSIALLWSGILLILNFLPSRAAIFSIIWLCFLIAVNSIFGLPLHGGEVVGNFFWYAQLIAQAVLYFALAISIYLESKTSQLFSVIFLFMMTVLNATIHLLPTLEMLGVVCGLVIVNLFFDDRQKLTTFKKISITSIFLIIAISSIIFSPSFKAMRLISENDGDIGLGHITYPAGVILLCVIVICSSLYLFYNWVTSKNKNLDIVKKYLAVYGATIASLCLLQFVLVNFGFGSTYAVKKYVFGLMTYLFIVLSILLGLWAAKFFKSKEIFTQARPSFLRFLILFGSLPLIFILVTSHEKIFAVADIVSLERQLIAVRDTSLPLATSKTNNVVIDLAGMPGIINYMFSVAIVKTDKGIAVPDVLMKNTLQDFQNYSYVLSSSGSRRYGASGCKTYANGTISIVDIDCLRKRHAEAQYCRGTFDFSTKGNILSSMMHDFSVPEGRGRWTDGYNATFSCRVENVPKKIKIVITPFLYGAHNKQRLFLKMNGTFVGKYEFTVPTSSHVIEFSPDKKAITDHISIEFAMPDAISTKELGLNGDARKLGFSIQSIQFE